MLAGIAVAGNNASMTNSDVIFTGGIHSLPSLMLLLLHTVGNDYISAVDYILNIMVLITNLTPTNRSVALVQRANYSSPYYTTRMNNKGQVVLGAKARKPQSEEKAVGYTSACFGFVY